MPETPESAAQKSVESSESFESLRGSLAELRGHCDKAFENLDTIMAARTNAVGQLNAPNEGTTKEQWEAYIKKIDDETLPQYAAYLKKVSADINAVTDKIKALRQPQKVEAVSTPEMQVIERPLIAFPDITRILDKLRTIEGRDPLFYSAVEQILAKGRASEVVLQQLHASLSGSKGYERATRILDQMTEAGLIGPAAPGGAREILITKEQWQALKDAPIVISAAPARVPFSRMPDTATERKELPKPDFAKFYSFKMGRNGDKAIETLFLKPEGITLDSISKQARFEIQRGDSFGEAVHIITKMEECGMVIIENSKYKPTFTYQEWTDYLDGRPLIAQ